jgi:hypothetical protein
LPNRRSKSSYDLGIFPQIFSIPLSVSYHGEHECGAAGIALAAHSAHVQRNGKGFYPGKAMAARIYDAAAPRTALALVESCAQFSLISMLL